MAQYTILRPSHREALDHVTERGESITLCGRRTTTTWMRVGPVLNGTQNTLKYLLQRLRGLFRRARHGFCLVCYRAVRKLGRDGTEN